MSAAIIWIILALVLIAGELFLGDLSLLMLGGGALAAAGAASIGAPSWASVAVFVAITALLLVLVRPALRKRMAAPDQADEFTNGPRSLPGRSGLVVEDVGQSDGVVRVSGQLWSARTLVPEATYTAGDRVTIVSVDGNTVVIDEEFRS